MTTIHGPWTLGTNLSAAGSTVNASGGATIPTTVVNSLLSVVGDGNAQDSGILSTGWVIPDATTDPGNGPTILIYGGASGASGGNGAGFQWIGGAGFDQGGTLFFGAGQVIGIADPDATLTLSGNNSAATGGGGGGGILTAGNGRDGVGGPATLAAGSVVGTGNGGTATLSAGQGGDVAGDGGPVVITAGAAGAGSGGDGGSIVITIGTGDGAGVAGNIFVNLPSSAGPSGTLWYDPGDANRVKYVP